jgi:hypothetical protein
MLWLYFVNILNMIPSGCALWQYINDTSLLLCLTHVVISVFHTFLCISVLHRCECILQMSFSFYVFVADTFCMYGKDGMSIQRQTEYQYITMLYLQYVNYDKKEWITKLQSGEKIPKGLSLTWNTWLSHVSLYSHKADGK